MSQMTVGQSYKQTVTVVTSKGRGFIRLFKNVLHQLRSALTKITTPYEKSEDLLALVQSLALKRDFAQARETASTIMDPYWRVMAFTVIADMSHEAKDFEQAYSTIVEISNPYERVKALTLVTGIRHCGL